MVKEKYDIVIMGAGHAGIEAATAACRIGAKTCIITKSINDIGKLSCNPSIGGTAKGIIVKEIDALDGVMAKAIDNTAIHFKVLNKNKGPAVWGIRAQADRTKYKKYIRKIIESFANLDIIYEKVKNILIQQNRVLGIKYNKKKIYCKKVVITTGTCLNSTIHIGEKIYNRNQFNKDIARILRNYNIMTNKFKTGTPPRLYTKSIDWTTLQQQKCDKVPYLFSDLSNIKKQKEKTCYITSTNKKTHEIILNNLHKSSIYSGNILAHGPRYCPSIEDKIIKFQDRQKHTIFLEPETTNDNITYPNGISNSLPAKIQKNFIRSIKGMRNVRIIKSGYAIEYIVINSRELKSSLEVKKIKNLFMAGQINGTTGYEEAAGQGLIAGANSALQIDNINLNLKRNSCYIGVMINDLTSVGTEEPYRIMTSRAEYRIKMRNDNAFLRLNKIAKETGLISYNRNKFYDKQIKKIYNISKTIEKNIKIHKTENIDEYLRRIILKYSFLKKEKRAIDHIYSHELYEKYNKKLAKEIKTLYDKDKIILIPTLMKFENIKSLSVEIKNKLKNFKPNSISCIKRIKGMTPAALIAISAYIKNM